MKREAGRRFSLKYPANKSPLFVRNTRKQQWSIASLPFAPCVVQSSAKVLPKNDRCLCAVLWTAGPPSFQFAWSSPPEPVCVLLCLWSKKSPVLRFFPLFSLTLLPPSIRRLFLRSVSSICLIYLSRYCNLYLCVVSQVVVTDCCSAVRTRCQKYLLVVYIVTVLPHRPLPRRCSLFVSSSTPP